MQRSSLSVNIQLTLVEVHPKLLVQENLLLDISSLGLKKLKCK